MRNTTMRFLLVEVYPDRSEGGGAALHYFSHTSTTCDAKADENVMPTRKQDLKNIEANK